MGNVTLPTPVFVAGGALALLAGYIAGSVLGPDAPENATATVVSYNAKTSQLCLEGDAVEGKEELNEEGQLCGIWSRSSGLQRPRAGDRFRFVSLDQETSERGGARGVVIFGTVVE